MKKLILALTVLFALSCENKEDNSCACTQQKYERTVIKNMNTQVVVSTTEWQAIGSSTPSGTDCDSNGRILSSGSENSHPLGNGNYSVTEFKYQINCK